MGLVIRFHHNATKSLQAMSYLVSRLGQIDKVKLTKLVYLADRQSFIETGAPITGSRLVAMPFGPVPSECLDMLNGTGPERDTVFAVLHVDDYKVSVHGTPDISSLSTADLNALDSILSQYGGERSWRVVDRTHELPEYQAIYVEGTSTTIPFELIASVVQDRRRYRDSRVVLTGASTAAMDCPFPTADATL